MTVPERSEAAEAVGVITEVKVGRGRVEVRRAGAEEWRPAGPLLALRAGDAVRAAGDATAVIVLSGGRGTARVDSATAPFAVPAPPAGPGAAEKVRALAEAAFGFLAASTREPPQAVLTVRGLRPPVILGPRNGPVLAGSPSVEWLGSRFHRYALRIVGPSGVVLERSGVTGARLDYPADAPPLTPGVRYTVQVLAQGHPAQEAWFEVVEAGRARAVREDLGMLEQAVDPGASPASLAVLQAAHLAREGLLHDARLALIAALTGDPEQPALYFLLGQVYARAGLPEQAAEAYDEAEFLMRSGAGGAPATRP